MNAIRLSRQELNKIISESINNILITEAFKSNLLRKFFQEHGGVDNDYRQFSLGDISDEQIGYSKEFNSTNEAIKEMNKLKKPLYNRQRSDYDMNLLFHIFTAKDGTAILVGVNRKTIETGVHWGGEHQKKIADRLWSNGWNFKTRDNRYVDDKDTYYYQSPAKDFGLHKNDNYKAKQKDLEKVKQRMTTDDFKNYRQKRIKDLRDYLEKYYPQTLKKLKKQ